MASEILTGVLLGERKDTSGAQDIDRRGRNRGFFLAFWDCDSRALNASLGPSQSLSQLPKVQNRPGGFSVTC